MPKIIPVDFGVYAFSAFKKASAVRNYRVLTPLTVMHRLGLANVYADDGDDNREDAARILMGSDIALGCSLEANGALATADSFRTNLKPTMVDGVLRVPPALVLDMDDAIEWIHPLNTLAYMHWGCRNWDGQIMSPGDEVVWTTPDGEDRVLWKDKVTFDGRKIWDIEQSIKNIEIHYEAARRARGMTVTCENLAQLYRDQNVKNVHVYPNCILEEDYFFPELAPHNEIRILWQGGSSHLDDWIEIIDPLAEVMNEHDNVKLIIFGTNFPSLQKKVADEKFIFYPWRDYNAYKAMRHCIGADINLCPLRDTPFNRCKSAIKWYEASIGPTPEPTLAAKCGPYLEMEDGVTGLTYSSPQEFKEKLVALIKSAELRKTLAARAKQWVLENRDPKKHVLDLYEFYQEIKREQRREALAV